MSKAPRDIIRCNRACQVAAHNAKFGNMLSRIGGLVVPPGVAFSPTAVHSSQAQRLVDAQIECALAPYFFKDAA